MVDPAPDVPPVLPLVPAEVDPALVVEVLLLVTSELPPLEVECPLPLPPVTLLPLVPKVPALLLEVALSLAPVVPVAGTDPHTPATQLRSGAQSPSLWQLVTQAVAAHA